MGLRTEIVNLIGLDLVDQTTEAGSVCQVAIMKMKSNFSLVRVRVDVIQTIRIESGRPANDAMHLIAFGEQELGQVRAILPRDSKAYGPLSLQMATFGYSLLALFYTCCLLLALTMRPCAAGSCRNPGELCLYRKSS